ncbi:papain fold toxin domain-containing protein [Microcoleus sp.]|uniref:papain fold toxin domain-containing protein n=1 Tax=Microcoleus sp. TaxID=44472 RepID=UPI003526176B
MRFTLEFLASGGLISLIVTSAIQGATETFIGTLITSLQLDKIGTCEQCAQLVKTEISRINIAGRHIRLETNGKNGILGLIWDDGTNQQIATNGFHEAIAIEFNNQTIVFDNIYPQGKPLEKWLNDLVVCSGNKLNIVQDDPF